MVEGASTAQTVRRHPWKPPTALRAEAPRRERSERETLTAGSPHEAYMRKMLRQAKRNATYRRDLRGGMARAWSGNANSRTTTCSAGPAQMKVAATWTP